MTQVESLEFRALLSVGPLWPAGLHAHKPLHHLTPAIELSAQDSEDGSGVAGDMRVNRTITNTTPYGYAPIQVRHAYGFDNIFFQSGSLAGTGSGQTIAIVDAYDDPNIANDLATFDTQWSLPAMDGKNGDPSFTKITPRRISANSGWALEESLDVEWAHAIAPQANIVLVEAASSSLSNLLSAVDTARTKAGVSVVSMSWGGGEFSSESSYDYHFTTPAGHTPVTFVASSGDSGAPIEWPAASPNVLSVGGTTLSLNSDNTIASETGWSGSGGGISAYESQPNYQSQSGVVSAWSTIKRTGPDVAYDANPNTGVSVYDSVSYNGQSGWFEVGGTSAGAPQWSALIAIADQGRALSGTPALDGPSQTLAAVYSMSLSNFHDITSGTSTGSPNYSAANGYDLVTGRGSPQADSLAQQLLGA